jgi:hypothetical protein
LAYIPNMKIGQVLSLGKTDRSLALGKMTSPGERHEWTSPQPWEKRTSKSNLENHGLRAGNRQGQTGPVQIEGGPKTLRGGGGKPDQYRGTDQAGAAWRNREEKYPVAKIKLHFRLK